VKLTIEIRARNGKFQELYQTLQDLIPKMREEKGCLNCRIYRDMEDGEVLFLSVHWKSQTSLKHYMQSKSASALLGAIDFLSENVKVGSDSDSHLTGFNSLKQMRRKT